MSEMAVVRSHTKGQTLGIEEALHDGVCANLVNVRLPVPMNSAQPKQGTRDITAQGDDS
jgi:hypothetical protein